MSINSTFKILYHAPMIRSLLQRELISLLGNAKPEQPIVVVCIGTDRSTGDSLGPLVGMNLEKYRSSLFHVYGTIAEPVHALNLASVLNEINKVHSDPFIIGVDACLGQTNSVGSIITGLGPVKPGAGVNKQLPPVGDMHITGVVNVGGFMEYFVLQNTRLHLVMSISDVIGQCLYHAIVKYHRNIAPKSVFLN